MPERVPLQARSIPEIWLAEFRKRGRRDGARPRGASGGTVAGSCYICASREGGTPARMASRTTCHSPRPKSSDEWRAA